MIWPVIVQLAMHFIAVCTGVPQLRDMENVPRVTVNPWTLIGLLILNEKMNTGEVAKRSIFSLNLPKNHRDRPLFPSRIFVLIGI